MSKKVLLVSYIMEFEEISKKIQVFDVLHIYKELNNPIDSRAIAVEYKGEKVGYLAKSKKFLTSVSVKDNPLAGEEIYDDFERIGEVRVLEKVGSEYGNDLFLCEVVSYDAIREAEQEAIEVVESETSVTTMKFLLKGAKTIYPERVHFTASANEGDRPALTLKKEKNKIYGYFGDECIGYVENNPPVNEGYIDYDRINSLFQKNEEVMAFGVGSKGIKTICEIVINVNEEHKEMIKKELDEVLVEIVSQGLMTEAELQERIEYMKENDVTETQMMGVFNSYIEYDDELTMRIPSKPAVLYIDAEGFIPESIAYINWKKHLLFQGDKAVGKNVLVETLAWLYKRPVFTLSMNADYDNNTLLGTRTIKTDENGSAEMIFELGVAAKAARDGCIIVFDEFNTIHPGLMTVFHSLLDKNRKLEVSGYGLIEAHDNFFAIATQNLDYQGTMDNNKATASRFVPFIFPELKNITHIIQRSVPDVTAETLNSLQNVFNGLKKLVHDGEIDNSVLDMRGMEASAEVATYMDIKLKTALLRNIANRLNDENERFVVSSMIDELLG